VRGSISVNCTAAHPRSLEGTLLLCVCVWVSEWNLVTHRNGRWYVENICIKRSGSIRRPEEVVERETR
jgi:hypothetical protein